MTHEVNPMKKILLAVIALSALAAACHERRQTPPDYEGVRARSEGAHGALDAQPVPADK